jgi:hypothetical protein
MNSEHVRRVVCAPAGETESGAGMSDTTGTLSQAKETITNPARDTAARIKSAATETASRAKAKAQNIANESKQQAAERIGGYGTAMRDSARAFEQQDPNIAWATNRVAERIERAADYVRNSDFDQMRRDGEDLARRHPVAFFGGMLVAGLVVGNLLKARQPVADSYDEADFDAGNMSGSEDPMVPTASFENPPTADM